MWPIQRFDLKIEISNLFVGFKIQEFLSRNMTMAPNTESKERLEKEAAHSRLVNGRFNTQGNFYMRLVFNGGKTHRSPHQNPESYYRGLN